jgi:hypothetical protein
MAEAQALALRIGIPVLALQIFAGRVRMRDQAPQLELPLTEMREIVRRTSDTDFASVRLQLRGLFRTCGPLSPALLVKGLRTFRLEHLPSSPEFSWWEHASHMARQGRLNEFLQSLLAGGPDDRTLQFIANMLERALDPNIGVRSA